MREAVVTALFSLVVAAGCSDTKPDCRGDATVCGDTCVSLRTDVANCGACGNVCPAGQTCSQGACACPTARPDACGDGASAFCTDLDTDPLNCGECGTACGAGKVCSAGGCTQTCSAGQEACPPVDPTYCASTRVDVNNCGACGAECPAAGQACSDGTCSCPGTLPVVCSAGGGSACTNLDFDPSNCGTCGNACAATSACHGGECGPVCTWTVTEAHSLASAPPGSELAFWVGTAGYGTAHGRSALTTAANWTWLRIPTSASATKFAAQVDFYSAAGMSDQIGLQVFSDAGPAPVQRTYGLGFMAVNMAELGGTALATLAYRAGDACNGWGAADCTWTTSGIVRQYAPVVGLYDGWRTLRVEGDRSSCRFHTYLDDVLIDVYEGACNTAGTNVFVTATGTAALANYELYTGTDGCVP